MALDETDRRSNELDRVLEAEIDGYEPPTDAELTEWRGSAPHPSDAADYESVESVGSGRDDE